MQWDMVTVIGVKISKIMLQLFLARTIHIIFAILHCQGLFYILHELRLFGQGLPTVVPNFGKIYLTHALWHIDLASKIQNRMV